MIKIRVKQTGCIQLSISNSAVINESSAGPICYLICALDCVYVMYKLRFCTSCNFYNSSVQVATFTKLAVQVATCAKFDNEIISTCTRGLYKLDLMKMIK